MPYKIYALPRANRRTVVMTKRQDDLEEASELVVLDGGDATTTGFSLVYDGDDASPFTVEIYLDGGDATN
jgi:hypothetical protein